MMNHKRKQTSYYRGHSTYYDYETEKWYYEDNDKYIESENRPCARCGKAPTLNGADYCLKDLEACDFIKAACCGHGERIGYISLQDGRTFRETVSNDILFKMFRLENENRKLREENEQLKERNEMLKKRLRKCANNWKQEIVERGQLEEENEQLKKENDDFHKSIKEYEELRKRLNKDRSRLIEEKMSLNAFVIEKGLMEEYMRWENE